MKANIREGAKVLLRKIINRGVGDRETLTRKLSPVFAACDVDEAVTSFRRRQLILYGIAGIGTLLIMLVMVVYSVLGTGAIELIDRSEYGDQGVSIPVKVIAEAEGRKLKETGTLVIKERSLKDDEKQEILAKYAASLPDLVLHASDEVRQVKGNLNLPEEDDEYGITVSWLSSDVSVISPEGLINVLNMVEDSQVVTLYAELGYCGYSEYVEFDVEIRRSGELMDVTLSNLVEQAAAEVSDNLEDNVIQLPQLENGAVFTWKRYRSASLGGILILYLLVMAILYTRRYNSADRYLREYRQSVAAGFPGVIDKLILLINSGLTVQNALLKISSDRAELGDTSPLGRELAEIGRRATETNTDIIGEWRSMSARMESSDMLRFTSVLEENANRGVQLAARLEAESESFREMRRKSLQQRIRMIDSRMMLPMLFMLFSLILITVSPAIVGF